MDKREFFARYPMVTGGLDPEVIYGMGQRVEWLKETYESSTILREVLLNSGYIFDEDHADPETWRSTRGGARNRDYVDIHLAYLRSVRDAARGVRPIITTLGITVEDINREELGTEWMMDPQLRGYVIEYENALLEALEEYDRKHALNIWREGVSIPIQDYLSDHFKLRRVLQQELEEDFNRDGYSVLDSAYYDAANRRYHACSEPFMKLKSHPGFGPLFTLDAMMVVQAWAQSMRDRYEDDKEGSLIIKPGDRDGVIDVVRFEE